MVYLKRGPTLVHRTYRCLIAWACGTLLFCAAAFADAAAQPSQRTIDKFRSASGDITVSPVRQMSVVIEGPGGVIYTDPTGGLARYSDYPAPDVILISHEHDEHFDADTLAAIVGPDTQLVVPPYVMQRLPVGLRGAAVSLANGEKSDFGSIEVEAIPAYGINGRSERWHPRGRGNGYVLTVDGRRIYVAGSTDATPEMLQLSDIYLALLPLYPPYALGPDAAVRAVLTLMPEFTYIYQYRSVRTRNEFLRKIESASTESNIIARNIDS
ncbi:MBL fold metallo-hydrolase [Halotalea alkalilenta]|uniref:MBL fold metallo-hydrolase n=1 Tax=Halotalea alkalilenta TaxID=376489 RepID=A0A172YEZ5_9GAMM|nr:MBL fold metallo-hydrolase [Halotalea alkalilenta]ANF57840.1 hypothetical protein A5892_10505 [Halotalea alkalilenta]